MINEQRLLDTFLKLVQIDSPSREEAAIAQELEARLQALGLTVERDGLNNVIASLPGQGTPLLLAAHMDTVMPGRGIKPVVKDGVVYSDGTTILGSDDKSGIAVILEVLQTIQERQLPHPPLEVVITVQEEIGLIGAKSLDLSRLSAREGISLDCGGPVGTIVVSAPSQNSLNVVVHGKAAHAGANPELGIDAILVTAQALVNMPLGRVDDETTANFGLIKGGTARNIVPDRVELIGEARSHHPAKLQAQTERMVEAFQSAARNAGATVDVDLSRSYDGYRLTEGDGLVRRLMAACTAVGVQPMLKATGGGSDANIFNAQGMKVVNISPGMTGAHTMDEHIAVADMIACARIVLGFFQGSHP
ncbi:MAG: M20/M25/M40 family metallo-hydrolase [Chloroflexi bacterium]|nr:M20/M25/M40 family metallo-hydrolase [Chloroflexota bacterium]